MKFTLNSSSATGKSRTSHGTITRSLFTVTWQARVDGVRGTYTERTRTLLPALTAWRMKRDLARRGWARTA